jgi:hypothetical protein
MTANVPRQFASLVGQTGANCMAWQTFIALNWQADPARPGYPDPHAAPADFGKVNNPNPTVWLSYADAASLFNAGQGRRRRLAFVAARPAQLQLATPFKFDTVDLSLSGIQQAGDRKWLTSQRGELTYYDVRLNEDEFQFITTNRFGQNDLTTYAGQAGCAGQPGQGGQGGFNLPGGSGGDVDCAGNSATYGQDQGAIEVKSAWVPLPVDGSLNYRYLTAQATITDPSGQQSTRTVGLVGLHIVHKVKGRSSCSGPPSSRSTTLRTRAQGAAFARRPCRPIRTRRRRRPIPISIRNARRHRTLIMGASRTGRPGRPAPTAASRETASPIRRPCRSRVSFPSTPWRMA